MTSRREVIREVFVHFLDEGGELTIEDITSFVEGSCFCSNCEHNA